MSKQFLPHRMLVALSGFLIAAGSVLAADNPCLGNWTLTIPGGHAGWLGVEQSGAGLKASMLWGWGSVEPVESAKVEGDHLVLTRKHISERKEANGKKVKTVSIETITGVVDGDNMKLSTVTVRETGQKEGQAEFTGHRMPPMPPAPDLSQVKFGPALELFNGKDLTGWRLTDPNAVSGWSVKDKILINNPVQEEGKPHKNYGNLRTDKEFEDFNLKVQTRLSKGSNSGIYLRGIYEIQVADTYGRPLDPHNMGALYSRITPALAAEKPAGEWQTLDITLVAQHVTVVLNGKTIINNQPALGCTGGALWSDVTRPGPIYVQGDHTGVEYRSVVIKPVVR